MTAYSISREWKYSHLVDSFSLSTIFALNRERTNKCPAGIDHPHDRKYHDCELPFHLFEYPVTRMTTPSKTSARPPERLGGVVALGKWGLICRRVDIS
jgi:hypothetical protein